jgi:hypothetical protein
MNRIPGKNCLALSAIILLALNASCKKEENRAEITALGPLLAAIGYPVYILDGTLNLDYSQSCGSAVQESTGSGSGSGSTSQATYKIDAFYYIDVGKSDFTFNYPLLTANLTMRFKYDPARTSYSFNPLNTVFTQCSTKDSISCDTTGTLLCDTVDGIKCGGVDAFIFTSGSQNIAFQAYTGTIDWSNGLTLNSQNTAIQYSSLEFSMIAENGSIFRGKISCSSPAN